MSKTIKISRKQEQEFRNNLQLRLKTLYRFDLPKAAGYESLDNWLSMRSVVRDLADCSEHIDQSMRMGQPFISELDALAVVNALFHDLIGRSAVSCFKFGLEPVPTDWKESTEDLAAILDQFGTSGFFQYMAEHIHAMRVQEQASRKTTPKKQHDYFPLFFLAMCAVALVVGVLN